MRDACSHRPHAFPSDREWKTQRTCICARHYGVPELPRMRTCTKIGSDLTFAFANSFDESVLRPSSTHLQGQDHRGAPGTTSSASPCVLQVCACKSHPVLQCRKSTANRIPPVAMFVTNCWSPQRPPASLQILAAALSRGKHLLPKQPCSRTCCTVVATRVIRKATPVGALRQRQRE